MTPRMRLVWALDGEITTATDLLGSGVAMMLDGVWSEHKSAPAFTCLASGIERLLKLNLGLTALADGDAWPAKDLRRKYRHHLDTLAEDVRGQMEQRIERTTRSPYIRSLLTEVDTDPYWLPLMEVLNAWADSSGRYRDFDILGGSIPVTAAPAEAWSVITSRVAGDLDLFADIGGPDFEEALFKINERLSLSILRWWHTIYRSWQHGMAGSQGKQFSSLLSPTDQRFLGDHGRRLLSGR